MEAAGIAIEKLSAVVHRIPDPAPVKVPRGMNYIEKTTLTIDGKRKKIKIEDPPQIIGASGTNSLHKGLGLIRLEGHARLRVPKQVVHEISVRL